eukprot:CAMPEP_0194196850 /NCGR_PEP_ID=MMETSP0154-20130528/76888_1 /TAXON_ID=1049557 /ORGANISM="Thalassiothrix antarctica, Strain L6-D1" /LENGTH=380 /DNA_ID=CAMNT_0038921483 /DNA_START=605 /DNA_END=1748 /DNA_ORIENTATION=+
MKRVNSTSGSRSDDEDYFLGISVGCNKGHDAIRTARMGMFTPEFDANQWGKAFHKNATITRGGCKQEFSSQATINAGSQSRTGEMHCIEPMPSTFHQLQAASEQLGLHAKGLLLTHAAIAGISEGGACKQESSSQATINVGMQPRTGEMHCIEPMPSTFRELQAASEQLGLHAKGLLLTHAAIAGISEGTIRFPKATSENMGQENVGIHSCNEYTEKCEDVPVYSLERYVERFVRKKHHPINILQIDVEGWDFDVLFGASSVLDKTHYLEFEYHDEGSWKKLHLQDAVMLLDGKGFGATGRQQKDSGVSPAAISNSTTTGMAGPTLLACTRPKVGCISEWKSSSWKLSNRGSSSSRNNVVLVLESGVHGSYQSESSHMDY